MAKITVKEFEDLYYSNTDKEIADKLGFKCPHTVRNYAKKMGLKLKGKEYVYPNDKRIAALSKLQFVEER